MQRDWGMRKVAGGKQCLAVSIMTASTQSRYMWVPINMQLLLLLLYSENTVNEKIFMSPSTCHSEFSGHPGFSRW